MKNKLIAFVLMSPASALIIYKCYKDPETLVIILAATLTVMFVLGAIMLLIGEK